MSCLGSVHRNILGPLHPPRNLRFFYSRCRVHAMGIEGSPTDSCYNFASIKGPTPISPQLAISIACSLSCPRGVLLSSFSDERVLSSRNVLSLE